MFFEEQADLGSDNEENDDVRKNINLDDEEENEEGHDEDLDGFVVHAADDEVVGEADEGLYHKHMEDMRELDRQMQREIVD